jgi:hypothetical protein
VVGNCELTGEACSTAEEDGVDGKNWVVSGEMPHGLVPQLHTKEDDVWDALDHLAVDKM